MAVLIIGISPTLANDAVEKFRLTTTQVPSSLQSPQEPQNALQRSSDSDPKLVALVDAAQAEPVIIERDQSWSK